MKIFVLCMAVLLCIAVAFGWQYSVSTYWDGSQHVGIATDFTPGSTTAHVTMCSPSLGGEHTCPVYQQEPPFEFDYTAKARVNRGDTYIWAVKRCGGIAYNSGNVTTNETWTLAAEIEQHAGDQISSQGPVTARVGNTQQSCTGS